MQTRRAGCNADESHKADVGNAAALGCTFEADSSVTRQCHFCHKGECDVLCDCVSTSLGQTIPHQVQSAGMKEFLQISLI
jgi:hypothetical protein